jgi:cell shape-determining protein MreC
VPDTVRLIKREMNKSNKDALIESLERKIKKLEDENKQLRKQLKVAYAEVYKKIINC